MEPCKTGDQPYSDPSPNGECSLPRAYAQFGFLFGHLPNLQCGGSTRVVLLFMSSVTTYGFFIVSIKSSPNA